ncbi:hypothetical protein ACFQ0M_10225 [Kitasatospora aburaviensis]
MTRLVDAVPGLRAVTNPLPAEGAADPETADGIRRNAPASLRTLNRAVSVTDHTELALAFPGIARARASTAPAGGEGLGVGTEIRLTVARADRQPLTGDHLTRLRRYLDARRDANQPLRIVDFTRSPPTSPWWSTWTTATDAGPPWPPSGPRSSSAPARTAAPATSPPSASARRCG